MKILEGMATKFNIDSEPPILTEPEVVDESEPKVINELEPEPEVKELLIKTFVDLPAGPIMEILSFSPAVMFLLSLRSPGVYDPLQIFL